MKRSPVIWMVTATTPVVIPPPATVRWISYLRLGGRLIGRDGDDRDDQLLGRQATVEELQATTGDEDRQAAWGR